MEDDIPIAPSLYSLSNKMDNSLLAVRDINHKYIVVDQRAFFGCKKLKEVYIPENIMYLGEEVFHGCNRLEYLEIHHDPEHIGSKIVNKNCTIRCKKGSKVDLYCEEQGLKREYI